MIVIDAALSFTRPTYVRIHIELYNCVDGTARNAQPCGVCMCTWLIQKGLARFAHDRRRRICLWDTEEKGTLPTMSGAIIAEVVDIGAMYAATTFPWRQC